MHKNRIWFKKSFSLAKAPLLASLVFITAHTPIRAGELPVPDFTRTWRGARIVTDRSSAHYMHIDAPGNTILSWQSFNVGEGDRVHFEQNSTSDIALNRIFQGTPSEISGRIDALGRIYLVNQNGIIFKQGAQVNVHTLLASSLALNIDESRLLEGRFNFANLINEGKAAFDSRAFANYDENYTPGDDIGEIILNQGVRINTPEGGQVLLFGSRVLNAGDIHARSGQVLLGASDDKIYLTPSTDNSLRGFLIELGNGGEVANLDAGHIVSERGNISLAGLAVNQSGTLQATTSVFENGSIRLLARDQASPVATSTINSNDENARLRLGIDLPSLSSVAPENHAIAGRTGRVTLGEGSQTDVSADASDTVSAPNEQTQLASSVEITGKDILLEKDAVVRAISGDVILHATSDPDKTAIDETGLLRAKQPASIVMQQGSRIDVSGSTDTVLDMQSNQIQVQLTENFLRDTPLQREGALRGETIYVDVREGTTLGDISDNVNAIRRGLSERLSSGGDVSLISSGAVDLQRGSEIDISAGQITYRDGLLNTSQLVSATGERVSVAAANIEQTYLGLFGSVKVESSRWGTPATRSWQMFSNGSASRRFYQGYTQGQQAGGLLLQTHALAENGRVSAGSLPSEFQRSQTASGRLNIVLGRSDSGQRAQDALISGIAQQQAVTDSQLQNYLQDGEDFAAPQWVLELDDAFFEQSGLSQFSLTSNGELRIGDDAQITMVQGAEFKASTYGITLDGQMDIVSGNVSLRTRDALPGSRGADLVVNGRIDVSGSWVNDSELLVEGDALLTPVNIDAGRISLSAEDADLVLTETSQLMANAGAWQNRGQNRSSQLKLGQAGEINLRTTSPTVSDMVLDGTLQAYGFNQGGVLDITANRIHIADQFTDASTLGELQLNSGFFRKNGFSDYRLTSTHSDLHVDAQTRLAPQTRSYAFNDDFFLQQSQRDVSRIAHTRFQPDYLRAPTHLALQVNDSAGQTSARGGLTIEKGAQVVLDPGSRFNLNSTSPIILSGDIINPGGSVDIRLGVPGSTNGFQADQGIWLDGLIDVRGVFIAEPSDIDTRNPGRLLDSGNVSVTADTGFIVLTENSLTEVSARNETLDVPVNGATGTASEFTPQQVTIEAGGIYLTAAEGVLVAGDVQGQGVSGSTGGAFSIDLNVANRGAGLATDFTQQARVLNVVAHRSALPVATPLAGSLENAQTGQGWIAGDTLNQGGFDRVSLRSRNNRVNRSDASATGQLVFQGDVNLNPAQSLTVQAPIIAAAAGSQVSLSAPYVLLGTPELLQPANVAVGGDARLRVQAGAAGQQGLLDFAGRSVLQGFDQVDLSSEGDIRLRGYADLQDGFRIKGGIEHVGDLQLTADQVYASTLTEFDIRLLDGSAPSTLSINGRGPDSPVLSAGSVLNLDAANIVQQGVLKAPLGEINLNATNRLLLADNSITSVSGEAQLIPFGSIQGQGRWVYPQSTSTTRVTDISAAPEKRISLDSPDIQIADSATLDLSGGGDLYAWEFVPGIGGSTDTLAPQNNGVEGSGAFAIIPGSGAFSAYDNYYWAESGAAVNPGEQIYLSGSENLAEGLYAIVPARYALLPGAVLVTPQKDFQNINPETRLARVDGGEVIAGQARFAGSSLNNRRWDGYLVETGERLRQRSEYFETTASRFFREQAQANSRPLPVMAEDAASLDIVADNNLLLAGQIRSDPGQFNWTLADGTALSQQGRGSRLNISGDYLRVLDEVDEQGGIQLLAGNLNALNVESIMLGGTRSQVSGGTQLDVSAQQIDIEAGLQLGELILAATQQINVSASSDETGAPVDTISTRGKQVSNGAISDEVLLVEGDGALLRASSASQVSVLRSNESATPVQGLLNIAQGASISVDQSLLLDASVDTRVQGNIQLNDGSLNVGASRISIGRVPQDNSQPAAPGLVFSEADISRMNADELILTSRGSVSLYSGEGATGGLDLQFNNLVIEAASLDGFQTSGQTARITVNETLRLGNRLGSPASQAEKPGTGDLVLSAGRIELSGENSAAAQPEGLAVRGFANADFNAQTLVVQGQGQLRFEVTDNVRLNAAKITAETAAQYQLLADNARLTLASNPAVAPPALGNPNESVGGSLTLQAQSIVHQGTIDIASGDVRLVALEGDIRLEDRALIDVSGVARNFAGTSVLTSGGRVRLEADQGNITQGVNALIDVSGGVDSAQSYGDAGRITIRAGRDVFTRLTQGTVDLQGQLQALHGDSARGGQFDLDSFSFNPVFAAASSTARSDFSVLNSQLEAGGFSQRRDIRLRSGDLLTAQTDVMNVRDLVLSADAGQLTLNAAINAAGESAGRVHLAAQGDVTVNAGIDVRASGEQQKGGQVNLESVAGSISVNLSATEVIDLSGAVDGRGGELNLWAARNSTGTDINISRIQGAIVGGEHINLVGFQRSEITDGVLDSELGSGVSGASSFLSADNISSISNRLNRDANGDARYANLHIGAGLDFWSAGDITLNTDIDFANTRFLSSDGVSETEAGVLNIRAAGHLNINASLEDGFREETVPIFSINYDRLLSGESWSYGLVAGADLNSAIMLRAVENASRAKNISLSRDERIRTGTGGITLAASGDLVLARNAVIYTAGRPTDINPRGSLDFFMPEFQASVLDFFVLPAVEFPEAGGDLSIRVGGDINAQVDSFLVSDWLHRTGGEHSLNTTLGLEAMPVSWGIDFHAFNQGVGALGGGNVLIEAGGDINRLSVSVPTTGKQTGDIDFTYDPVAFSFSFTVNSQELTELGQGNISVQAQGDINQGLFYAGNGNIDVSAGGDIGSASTTGIQLVGADTRSRVLAGGDIYLQGIATPGLLPYSVLQNNKMNTIGASLYSSFFNTYTEQSASALFSLTGDININRQTDISLVSTRASFVANAGAGDLNAYYPGSLSLRAFDSDINIENGFNLQPSSSGQLTMLAQGNIVSLGSTTVINMSDLSTEQLPGVDRPVSNFSQYSRFFSLPQFQHASVPVHQNNPNAVRIVTNEGDIKPLSQRSLFQFILPRRAEVIAARDISNLNLIIQNINDTDVSIVQAGRDINYLNSVLLGLQGSLKNGGITLAGPGELQLLAGRNIDLGNQLGVRTVGNSFNAALGERDQGGDIYMLAGLGDQGADVNGFIDTYLTAESEYAQALITFMAQRNTALASFDQALSGFRQLDRNAQRTLVLQMFFSEIKAASTRAANELANAAAFDQLQGYTRGLEAISVLFPGTITLRRPANPGESSDDSADLIVTGGNAWQIPLENTRYQGNISLTSSGIATNNGGDINLLAPGGLLNVGLTVASDNTSLDLGVISRGSGDISIYTHNDVGVNESRIQALDGGNILAWSTMGNIDAGRGARAALFLPPPTTLIDPDTGDVSVVFDATVQGSGVRSAAFSENRQPGDVVLAAPKGLIDAGDAGIDAGGGIILATTTVLNSGNIDAGGGSVGVPTSDSGALGASLSLDVNSSGSSVAQATSLVAQDASGRYGEGSVAILSVQVLGMGEDESAEDESRPLTQD